MLDRFPRWMKALAAAVAALTLLYGALWIPWGGRGPRALPPADPVKIRIESPRSEVALEKKGDAWRVTAPVDWPADEEAVRRLLSGLKALALESEVTRRAESHAQYEVEEGKAARLRVWPAGAERPFELFLGKNAGFTDRAYVRVGAAPEVYLAAGLSRDDVDLPPVRWRDRRVVDRSDIEWVRVARAGGRVSLIEKSSSGWTVDGKAADAAAASAFLSALRTLAADDLADGPVDAKARGLDKPAATFEVAFSSGAPVVFSVGARGDPRPVRRQGADALYWVPAYRLEPLDEAPAAP